MNSPVTREDVFAKIKEVMINIFEIEPEKITPSAVLSDDLDIDSIDAVDLVVELQNFSHTRFTPEDFKNVRTVDDIVHVVMASPRA